MQTLHRARLLEQYLATMTDASGGDTSHSLRIHRLVDGMRDGIDARTDSAGLLDFASRIRRRAGSSGCR